MFPDTIKFFGKLNQSQITGFDTEISQDYNNN